MLDSVLMLRQYRLPFKFEYIFYILGILSFIFGVFVSSIPVFTHPIGVIRIKGDNQHNGMIYLMFFIGCFCISLPLLIILINILYTMKPPTSNLWSYLLIPICLFLPIFFFLQKMMYLSVTLLKLIKRRHSLRPLYCIVCQRKLKLINQSLISLLNEKELAARRIKSIYFEAWHCHNCAKHIERDSVHLRLYPSLSDRYKVCHDCKELTMKKSASKITKEATITQPGEKLIVYTCNFCGKKEHKIEIIPMIEISIEL